MKIRKQFYLESRQAHALKRAARRTGVSEAEIIRGALEEHLRAANAAQERQAAWDRVEAFTRSLMEQEPVPGGRTWRREELYRHSES